MCVLNYIKFYIHFFEKQLIEPMASVYKSYKPYEGTSYISQTLVLEAFYNGYNDFP